MSWGNARRRSQVLFRYHYLIDNIHSVVSSSIPSLLFFSACVWSPESSICLVLLSCRAVPCRFRSKRIPGTAFSSIDRPFRVKRAVGKMQLPSAAALCWTHPTRLPAPERTAQTGAVLYRLCKRDKPPAHTANSARRSALSKHLVSSDSCFPGFPLHSSTSPVHPMLSFLLLFSCFVHAGLPCPSLCLGLANWLSDSRQRPRST